VSQPIFGITAGTEKTASRAKQFGADFVDLHFRDDVESLLSAMDDCDGNGVKYLLNFEGAPVGWAPPDDLKRDLAGRPGYLGFLLDEADHMQINAHWPVIDYYGYDDRHYLAETEGLDLVSAREAVLSSLRRRGEACAIDGKPAAVEFLFPVMMHTTARAGLTVSPKLLKETCGPAMLAAAMGAARQYGVDFWVDVDYWWHNEAIAAIEKAYAEFIQDYVPDHARPYDWRDFRPQTAVIRFDDTCFDQRQMYLGEYPGPLYGHVPAGPENTEWLNIWSLLSHGFVRTDSVSHQWEARRFGCRTLFVPLHNVAVYDHQVEYETLAGLRLIFLTGTAISAATLQAVQRCVKEGATCVLPPRLAPPGSDLAQCTETELVADGPGRWLVVPEFYRLHYECFCAGPVLPILRETLADLIGDGDHLVYDFGRWTARLGQAGGDYPRHDLMTWRVPLTQAGTNPDVLEVEISEGGA
jgi:hypothetical protein